MAKKKTILDLYKMKETGEQAVWMVLYDACFASYAEEAGMEFNIMIPEEPYSVQADRAQAGRIFTNLITNAIRHNPQGTEIAVIGRRLAGVEYIAVADTGRTIEGDTAKLFDPFVKGDASRTGDKGSGLGLSISKKIAELHGWELSLQQPYEKYTKAFVLCIPED